MYREKATMEANVLENEPHLALFVPDDDPLLFYRAIARFGQRHLAEGGHLYFEINALCGKETVAMLRQENYTEVELIQDLYGKDRIVKAKRNRQKEKTSGTYSTSYSVSPPDEVSKAGSRWIA